MKVLVTGAGGMIGGHLVKRLLEEGHEVRAVDIKPIKDWWQIHDADNRWRWNLARPVNSMTVTYGMERVYNLAADMGGIGFITENKARCMESVLINTHLLQAARETGVERYLFTSSACVYPQFLQEQPALDDGRALSEDEAYVAGADPEDGYGWEKLFSERMCRHFTEDYGLETRVARLHNVYGPHGTWEGGREKAPAAICRKVAEAIRDGEEEIEIWGDGMQTRSFMYVDDCVEGLIRIMEGEHHEPVNLGSSELVSIHQLVEYVEGIAGQAFTLRHDLNAPQGVRGRNSNNGMVLARYGWQPSTPLSDGLRPTYAWIAEQVGLSRAGRISPDEASTRPAESEPKERSDWAMPEWGRAST